MMKNTMLILALMAASAQAKFNTKVNDKEAVFIFSGKEASDFLNKSNMLPISDKEVTIKGDQCSIDNQGSYAMVLDATKNKKGDRATYHIHLLNPYNLDSTKLQEEIPNTLREENKVCSVTVKENK